jgi:membrane-associated protease RseP (regulator of RpoE activity)
VTVANLSPALADELRLDPQTEGVVVTAVADGSPARSLGFQKGDIVLSVNNQKIDAYRRERGRPDTGEIEEWAISVPAGLEIGHKKIARRMTPRRAHPLSTTEICCPPRTMVMCHCRLPALTMPT